MIASFPGPLREFRTASDERAGPGNEARYMTRVILVTWITSSRARSIKKLVWPVHVSAVPLLVPRLCLSVEICLCCVYFVGDIW